MGIKVTEENKCTSRMLERWFRKEKVVCSNPSRNRPKTGSDSSTAKRSTIGVSVSRVLEDDHYKRMPRVTVGVAR